MHTLILDDLVGDLTAGDTANHQASAAITDGAKVTTTTDPASSRSQQSPRWFRASDPAIQVMNATD